MENCQEIIESLDADELETIEQVLSKVPVELQQRITLALQEATSSKLSQVLLDSIIQKKRAQFWLVNQEYSRRGMPPVFRGLPNYWDPNGMKQADLIWVDLEWLWARYRQYKPENARWKSIYASKEFYHPTAAFIWETVKKAEMWKVVRGLNLDDDMQCKLHVIKVEKHSNKIKKIESRMKEIEINLRAKWHSHGITLPRDQVEHMIRRRLDIWVCAVLADRSPQRTATLYEAKTGQSISRQLASKTIGIIERDIPTAFKYLRKASR